MSIRNYTYKLPVKGQGGKPDDRIKPLIDL